MINLGIYKEPSVVIDFAVGDSVTVTSGAWAGTVGMIRKIDEDKKSVTIYVDMFGRETPVELAFTEVKKM
jgi:transcriptional antiterminator NusG